MGWTNFQIILVVGLVISGSFNTLSTKWADRIESAGEDGIIRVFNHPFFQTVIMFSGEMLCLLMYRVLFYYFHYMDHTEDERHILRGNRSFSIWIFVIPSICDIMATSIMYLGLTLTYASSFQMLRGIPYMFQFLLDWLNFELLVLLQDDPIGQIRNWQDEVRNLIVFLNHFQGF